MPIKYITHTKINKTKWDNCISLSENGLIYGNSWYLDIVCDNWDALILDDYKAVMPLPWKSKFGVKYIYHPFFSQQLGLFYCDSTDNNIAEYINKIPLKFIKYELSCNSNSNIKQISATQRVNYILDINSSYTELYRLFSENNKRNIKKGNKNNLEITSNITIDEFLTLKKENNISNLDSRYFKTLHKLFKTLINNNYAKIVGIYDKDRRLMGAALFVEFNNRITYLFSASSDTGKSKRVMFAIVNSVIKENAGNNKTIDFEGSMIEGIARFFKGFGAKTETYYHITKSKIPFVS